MISYGDSVDRIVLWAQNQDWFDAAASIVLVRDLAGRVRLVVDGDVAEGAEESMAEELEGWSGGLLVTTARLAEGAIAKRIVDDSTAWPSRWPTSVSDGFGNEIEVDHKWRAFERVGGKESWLDTDAGRAPWPLHQKTPGIATFFSFKGGVGRTTALAISAATLAEKGHRVLCIDLDLEAPGLADAFGLQPISGTVDLLLEHHLNGALDATAVSDAISTTSIGSGKPIDILPAAAVDGTYIERVARLDYLGTSGSGEKSPVERGIEAILRLVKAEYDVILLDARAGIHDLGGLAMLSVSHATVIVFRPDRQALAGLDLVLPVYASRRSEVERRLVLATSFVPEDPEVRNIVMARWRRHVFDRCEAPGSIYDELDEPPGFDNENVPHDLVPLPEAAQLSTNENLQGHTAPPTDLFGYRQLVERLEAVLAPEDAT